jgi:hypothetical protein
MPEADYPEDASFTASPTTAGGVAEHVSHSTGDIDLRQQPGPDHSTLETVASARLKLVEVERALRDLWYDAVDTSPVFAARINAAVRFSHRAVEALSDATLL